MSDIEKRNSNEKAVEDREYVHSDDESSLGSVADKAGVKGIEAITTVWSTAALAAAYAGILLVATAYSLEQQSTLGLSILATSAFQQHSLVSTVYVVQGVVNACLKPVMAKIANVFGRLEAFSFSILLYILGYIQMASSRNVATFASAQIFYSAGFTGLLITTQILIADTSDLRWRALFSSLPDVPFLWTVWVGPLITAQLAANWRWGYGLWAIVLPVAYIPLAVALFHALLKAKKQGTNPPRPWAGVPLQKYLIKLWFDMDVLGLLVLSAAISLILLPLTLAASAKGGWNNASMIAMEVVGGLCLIAFPFIESNKKLAPSPFMPFRILKFRNVSIGLITGIFYFAAFYTSVFPYFNTYLQVVQNQSIIAAGHITQVFSFTSTVASVIVGLIIRFTKHYKYWTVIGSAVYIMGIGLMFRYRREDVSIATNVGVQIAVGVGAGMYNVPMQLAVQAAVPHIDVATATALYLTFTEIGGAIGSAISGAVWSGNLPGKLAAYLPAADADQAFLIYGNYSHAKDFPVGTPARIGINRAYQETMTTILTVSVCLAAPVFLLVLFLKSQNLDKIDQKVTGKVIGSASHVSDSEDEITTEKKSFFQRWMK